MQNAIPDTMNADGDGRARGASIDRVSAGTAWALAVIVAMLVVLDMTLEWQRCISDRIALIVFGLALLLHTMRLAQLQFAELMLRNYSGVLRVPNNIVLTVFALVVQPICMALSVVWPAWAVRVPFDVRILFAQAALYAAGCAVLAGAVVDLVLTKMLEGVSCVGLPVANLVVMGVLIAIGINYWRPPPRTVVHDTSALGSLPDVQVDLFQAKEP